MNNLCADIGWKSINHEGEQLCGDHVDIVEQSDDSTADHRVCAFIGLDHTGSVRNGRYREYKQYSDHEESRCNITAASVWTYRYCD